jgi:PhoH-like ATPase
MEPIYDNLQWLVDPELEKSGDKVQYLFDAGVIEVEAVTYIRGRSLPKLFIIIDEAQNLTPHEVKTVISRAGADSKVILTGDAYQIDNPYLDASSNGLTYVVERFKREPIFGHITLLKSERSELASLAARLL